jgi:hypothetical protein
MRFTSLSIWLACSIASSTRAFSTFSKKYQAVTTRSTLSFGAAPTSRQQQRQDIFQLGVASADTVSVANMERGVGGRIEAAFEAAKEKGEAAFVTFITAGYPSAQGTSV